MAKVTLSDLANLSNEASAIAAINANNTLIENEFDNSLSRDGSSPNAMEADLDMNSNHILNLPAPVGLNEPVRLRDLNAASTTINVGESWINVKDRGIDFTDSDSAATANSTLIAELIEEGGALWFEEGDPWFAERISFENKMMNIRGMGKGHTRLHFKDPASNTPTDNVGIYYVNDTLSPYAGADVQPIVEGITLYAEYDSNGSPKDGTGLWLEQQKASGAEDGPQITNVHVRGVTGGANQNCWNVGYRVLGFGVGRFTGCSASLKQNVSEACVVFDDSTAGSQASINPSLYKCSLYSAKYGVKFLGANEGGRLVGCNLQEVNWGVYKDHGANNSQPFMSLINTHINSYLGGVDIVNGRYVIIDGCLWYAKVDADADALGLVRTDYYFVRSIGPNDGPTPSSRLNFGHIIANSKFKANAVGIAPDTMNIYGVYADYTDRSIVTGCTFESCTKPIYLAANTNDWYIPDTNTAYVHPQDTTGSGASYTEPTDFVTDLGTNNIVHHDGYQWGELKLRDQDRSHFLGLRSAQIVSTSHYLTLHGKNTSRSLLFGGDVDTTGNITTGGAISTAGTVTTGGNFTTNGDVEISTFAATMLDDSNETALRRTIKASRYGWVFLEAQTANGTDPIVFSNINQNYNELVLYFAELSHNDAGNQHFRVEISFDNGTNWSTPVVVSANQSAAAQLKGQACTISNYVVTGETKIVMAHGVFTQGTGVGYLEDSTADSVDAVRVSVSSGFPDSGSVRLYAR